MGRLDGKVAVIGGAGTGVGRACMVRFAEEGAKVVGAARTQSDLDETLALVEADGGEGAVVVGRPLDRGAAPPTSSTWRSSASAASTSSSTAPVSAGRTARRSRAA